MRRIILATVLFSCITFRTGYAAPCYGTKMPALHQLTASLESYSLLRRYLESEAGKVRSQQQFFGISYGLTPWLCLDLKAGTGSIRQRPNDQEEVDYKTGFAGGYGLRVRLFEHNQWRAVFGFHHISVHPYSTHVGSAKNQAILDDWQTSVLGSYDFSWITPYIGARWSRVDYIHKQIGIRKRVMSDLTKSYGVIAGVTIPFNERIWMNIEGQLVDAQALAVSFNYNF